MLLDVNVLLYAVDRTSPQFAAARGWLGSALTGQRRIGFPWQTIGGFLRIATHQRVFEHPLSVEQAWSALDGWLASPVAWIPNVGDNTVALLRQLMLEGHGEGSRTTDVQLAALALEHSVPVVSADADFQRFADLEWINPFR